MGRLKMHKAPTVSGSMISIWDSGIEYGEYSYDTSVYNNMFGFEADKNDIVPPDYMNKNFHKENLHRNMKLSKTPKWSDFTKSTTFHGMRYVFDDGPFAIRRILWITCVLSAVILFCFQVVDRARAYFNYDTNTNVEVVYVDKVEFPSITLCNQNNFRITEAVKRDLYPYIVETFSADDKNNTTYDGTPHKVNLTEFVLSVAHQKNDFIDSCTWKGEICDINYAFDTTVTDFGVCYTFNSNGNLTLSHTGSGFALSLVLNIEQYQYMTGPQDEAGIKVLLHDFREVPLVKDLGFAIAPGTHTLVAVQKQVVKALEKPYGTCVQNSFPRSKCLSECRTEFVLSQCGCRDVGMPNMDNTSVCSMEMAFTCVRKTMALFTKEDRSCSCDIPCDRITFQPELSYAHLSKLNVNRISLNDVWKRQKVQKTFESAREVEQRVNDVIATKDAQLVDAVLNASAGYAHNLDHSLKVLDDSEYLRKELGLVNVVFLPYPIFLDDFSQLDILYVTKSKVMSKSFPDFIYYDHLAKELQRFVETRESNSILRMTVLDCAEKETTGRSSDHVTNYYECADIDTYTYLYYKRNTVQNILQYTMKMMPIIENVWAQYKNLMEYLYGSSTLKYHLKAKYHLCLDNLIEIQQEWLPILDGLKETCKKYLNATSWKEKLMYIDEIIEYDNITNSKQSSLSHTNFDTCNWFKIPGAVSLEDKAHALFLAHADSAKTSYYDARGIIQQLVNQGIKMKEDFDKKSLALFSAFHSFQKFEIRKTDLYRHISSHSFRSLTEDLRLDNERYMTDYRQFLSKVSDVENNLLLSFNYSFSFIVPVINDSVINNLEFIKYVEEQDNMLTDSNIGYYLERLRKTGAAESFKELINELYGKYRRMIQDVHSKILQSFQELAVSLTLLQADLQNFVQGNDMGEEFFMENFIKIDIFYKELSYEQIKQQVAFELLSLVSEIGGFLGLLLGASILTVCELIDFLVLAGINECKNRNFMNRNGFN